MCRVLCWKTCLGLGWHSLCSFGGQSLFEWQLKLGQLLTVHTAGGPMSSNLPASFPSSCPAALSAGSFGSPLGKLQGLFTFQFCRDQAREGAGWPVGLCSLVITKEHGCLFWSLDCSGVIAEAQFELMLQITEEFTSNMEKHGLKIHIRNNEFKDFFNFPSL